MNTNKLRGKMVEEGYTQKSLSAALAMSEKTFYNKLKRGVFGTDEVKKMVELLHITDPADIFLS